jgi:hypothetical protein
MASLPTIVLEYIKDINALISKIGDISWVFICQKYSNGDIYFFYEMETGEGLYSYLGICSSLLKVLN